MLEARMFLGDGISPFEHMIIGIIYCITFLGGLFTTLSVFKVLSHGVVIPAPRNVLHLHLAVANIALSTIIILPAISSLCGRWIWGDFGCQAYAFSGFLFGLLPLWLIAFLAVDCYLATAYPDLHSKLTSKHYHGVGLLVWGQSLFWSMMPLYGWSSYDMEPTNASCTIDYMSQDENHLSFFYNLAIFTYVIPLTLIGVFVVMAVCALPGEKNGNEESTVVATNTQHVKIITVLFMMSVLSWTPYALFCSWRAVTSKPDQVNLLLATLPPLFAKIGTAIISLVYFYVAPKFHASLYHTRTKED